MEALSTNGFKRCPECGADNPPQNARCWLCGAALDRGAKPADRKEQPIDAEVINPYQSPPPAPVVGTQHQFRLITLFLIVTVICLCLGLWRSAPGLAIPLLIIAVPALARASAVSRRVAAGGKRASIGDFLIAFATSVALVIVTIVAGIVAFCIACVAALSGLGTQRVESIIGAAVLGGLATMTVLIIATWPRRKRE